MPIQDQPSAAVAASPRDRIRSAPNLGAAFLDRLAAAPGATVCLEPAGKGFRRVSVSEFGEEVVDIARALSGFGLVRGDRIALMGPNGPFWAAVDWAAQLLGLVVVPLYQG